MRVGLMLSEDARWSGCGQPRVGRKSRCVRAFLFIKSEKARGPAEDPSSGVNVNMRGSHRRLCKSRIKTRQSRYSVRVLE